MSAYESLEGVIVNRTIVPTSFVQNVIPGNGIDIVGAANPPTIRVEQSIIDDAAAAVQSITAGTNISLAGTAMHPIINVTGVVKSVSAGTNATITGTATDPIINSTASAGGFEGALFTTDYLENTNLGNVSFDIGNWTTTGGAVIDATRRSYSQPAGAWTTVDGFDTTTGGFNLATGDWTVPKTGYWEISYSIYFYTTAYSYIYFMNTTTQQFRGDAPSKDSPKEYKNTFTLYLTQNDVCRFHVETAPAANHNCGEVMTWNINLQFISST